METSLTGQLADLAAVNHNQASTGNADIYGSFSRL